MEASPQRIRPFPTAQEDAQSALSHIDSPQTRSDAYRLAYQDPAFILRDELRPVRLQLELLKPELILQEKGIESTVVIFGSARLPDPVSARIRLERAEREAEAYPDDMAALSGLTGARRALANSRYYEEARELTRLISCECQKPDRCTHVVTTGGGGGIMEAANRGAHEARARSIGLNIVLPHEQAPNPYISPDLSFQFHYFAIRKMHFLMRAKALVAFPGGFGTLDEVFETLTLVQTGKICPIPVLLFGKDFWERLIRFETLVEDGTISPEDLSLFRYVESAREAWEVIRGAE